MGRHSRGDIGRREKLALAIAAAAGSEGLGVALISWGNHLSAQDYNYDVVPWGFWGAFFTALSVIAVAIVVVAAIAKAAAAEHRRYREWKASLQPEERLAVELAVATALTAAAIAIYKRYKRRDAQLTSSVMGYTMSDGRTPRAIDRIAAYRQRTALRLPPQQPWTVPDMTPDPHTAAS